jgi:hypothetical protein
MHRFGDILECLQTHILLGDVYLAPNLPTSIVGDTDAAGVGYSFKARGNVDAIAEDVVVIDDDIADVDADPEIDPHCRGDVGVLRRHSALDFDRTARGVDRTRKLDQHAVAGGLDDAAAMRSDRGVDNDPSSRLQPGQRAFLVGAHETAVTGDIGSQYRYKSSFHALAGQNCL